MPFGSFVRTVMKASASIPVSLGLLLFSVLLWNADVDSGRSDPGAGMGRSAAGAFAFPAADERRAGLASPVTRSLRSHTPGRQVNYYR